MATSNVGRQILQLSDLKYGKVVCAGYQINAPIFLINAFKIIRRNDKNVGIFRLAGQQKRVKELKKTYFGEPIPDDTPVNDVCDAVKAFFRELEEPLLTSALEKEFIQFDSAFNRDDIRLRSILHLCRVLTQRRRETLAFLMWQLKRISDNCKENRMDIKNLAMVFAMSIFHCEDTSYGSQVEDGKRDASQKASVVELLINNADKLCALARRSEPLPNRGGRRYADVINNVDQPARVEITKPDHSHLACIQKDNVLRESNNGDAGYCQNATSTATNPQFLQPGSPHRPSVSKTIESATPTKMIRSISDSAEKRRTGHAEAIQRRRSVGAQSKIKRGQPNSIYNGLSKSRSKPTSKRSSPISDVETDHVPVDPVSPHTFGFFVPPDPVKQTSPLKESQNINVSPKSAEEERDTFADSDLRKLQLLSSKSPTSANIFRTSSVPTRDRPSIAILRQNNAGRVLRQAAFYETVAKKTVASGGPAQELSRKNKTLVPTFTQIANGSKRRSPTKVYHTMSVRKMDPSNV